MKYTPLEVYRLIKHYREIRSSWEPIDDLIIGVWDVDLVAEHLSEEEFDFLFDWILLTDQVLEKLYKIPHDTLRKRQYRLANKLSEILIYDNKG
jgi:hypothetical protein